MRHDPVFQLPPSVPYILIALLIGPLLWFVLQTLAHYLTEILWEAVKGWRRKRHAFWDAEQSQGVRLCAESLATRRTKQRIEAVEIMMLLDDASAVPALLRAAARYERDVPFLLVVIDALQQLGDARALPMLHHWTEDRHYGLMQAARKAIETLESRHILLRASAPPPPRPDMLLRPATAPDKSDPQMLLRAHYHQNP